MAKTLMLITAFLLVGCTKVTGFPDQEVSSENDKSKQIESQFFVDIMKIAGACSQAHLDTGVAYRDMTNNFSDIDHYHNSIIGEKSICGSGVARMKAISVPTDFKQTQLVQMRSMFDTCQNYMHLNQHNAALIGDALDADKPISEVKVLFPEHDASQTVFLTCMNQVQHFAHSEGVGP
jgi:hypothetical protein